MNKKQIIALIIFIIGIIFVVVITVHESSKTGCIYGLQKARPLLENMPPGEIFYASDVEYECSWDFGKIMMIIGAGFIGLAISRQVLEKHKAES